VREDDHGWVMSFEVRRDFYYHGGAFKPEGRRVLSSLISPREVKIKII